MTGKIDIKNGKGAPGRGQLYIDGKPLGQGDIPLTMPLIDRSCRGYGVRRRHRLAGLGQIPTAIQVHWHALQRDRGRERRVHQGQRSGDARAPGAAVGTLRMAEQTRCGLLRITADSGGNADMDADFFNRQRSDAPIQSGGCNSAVDGLRERAIKREAG